MIKRVLSAAIGIPILLYIVNIGGAALLASIIIVTIIAVHEYVGAYEKSKGFDGISKNYGLYRYWLWICTLISYAFIIRGGVAFDLEAAFLFIVFLGVSAIELLSRSNAKHESSIMLYGYVYITVFFRFVYHTSQMNNNMIIWLIFITAWSTDTFAYFSGLFFGKHKLAPIISPKKTIEGAIGGIIGCALSVFVFSILFIPELVRISILFGVLGSVISQFGDLSASLIKRRNGIKDFGNLMPGHGGVLDRFDSILFTAPYVYLVCSVLYETGVIK